MMDGLYASSQSRIARTALPIGTLCTAHSCLYGGGAPCWRQEPSILSRSVAGAAAFGYPNSTAFKRAAVTAAISRAGFSLPVSGQIAYFMPFHTLMFTACDPIYDTP